jgi:hypothetical protein
VHIQPETFEVLETSKVDEPRVGATFEVLKNLEGFNSKKTMDFFKTFEVLETSKVRR